MEQRTYKVAILHRDSEIVARVTRVATRSGLDIIRPLSLADLAHHIHDPRLRAIVTELPAPRDGGIAALERLHNPYGQAAIVLIADLDPRTAEGMKAAAKGLGAVIFPAQAFNEAELARLLAGGKERAPQFGPAEIDNCLDGGHFWTEYQPKVSLLSTPVAAPFGVEALCRMRDPDLGMISPDKFIPMAEKCGLIAKLTDMVTCEAFKAWRSWKAAGLCLRLALNVSPVLLGDGQWPERFLQRCAEFDVDPKWITLEITETAAGATSERACEILTRLQGKGFSLSIDDFGTGYSSLASLYRLPISEMKIDKSFIFDLQGTAGARKLVESAIAMAARMGIKVVAEGVETESVFEELRRIGCHEVQGFFIGKSMPADAVVGFFTSWRNSRLGAPAAGGPAKGLPKVAILQALLNDIVSDRSLDTTVAPRGPYAAQTPTKAANGSKDLVRRLPPLVLEGKILAALCHDAVHQLRALPACNDMHIKVGQLQSHLEQELLTGADLELHSPQRVFRLLAREAVTVGRPSGPTLIDIPVRCRWFPIGDKNLRIFAESGQWFVEDMGSTHGYLINGKRIAARRPFELGLDKTLVEVRMASRAVAPLSLVLRRSALNPDAVTIDFDYDAQSLRTELGEKAWSEVGNELDCTWVVFNGKISIGRLSDCTLALADCVTPVAAEIYFQQGYWISPGAEAGFTMDGTSFRQDVPLMANSELVMGQTSLIVREAVREQAVSAPSKTARPDAVRQIRA